MSPPSAATPPGPVRRVRGAAAAGVRLADAVSLFLGTISVANTRRGCSAALQRMVADLGADTDVAGLEPDRDGSFIASWGGCAPKTFNTRLTALGSA